MWLEEKMMRWLTYLSYKRRANSHTQTDTDTDTHTHTHTHAHTHKHMHTCLLNCGYKILVLKNWKDVNKFILYNTCLGCHSLSMIRAMPWDHNIFNGLENVLISMKIRRKKWTFKLRKSFTLWKRLWCWEGLGAGGEGDDRGWDGWMASLTRWTWVWVNSGSWWWIGRPGVLGFMGIAKSRTRLSNWIELN